MAPHITGDRAEADVAAAASIGATGAASRVGGGKVPVRDVLMSVLHQGGTPAPGPFDLAMASTVVQSLRNVLAAGPLPLGRRRCGLRRSALSGWAAGRSPKRWVVRLDASRRRAPCCASADRLWFGLSCATFGCEYSWYRVGASEGRMLASQTFQPLRVLPSWLTSHAWHVCFDA